MNTLITIIGTTAIGKTSLAIKLAQHFNCDILSCDSRQFYKEMSIGTAVPNKEELATAKHHFIQNRSIFDDYNVGSFEKDALTKLDKLFRENATQIMVGGSGLYADAVIKGLDYFPDVALDIRTTLTKELNNKGIEYLQNRLKNLDVEAFNSIAIDNPHRLIRALEICIGTGKTYTSFKNKPKTPRNFKSIIIGLTADRDIIYDRINRRVDMMLENGLIEEAKKLYPYRNLNALQTVGYRELFAYLDGEFSLDIAIDEIKKNTRRFAKRQTTWFKRYENVLWFDYNEDIPKILESIVTSKHYINGV